MNAIEGGRTQFCTVVKKRSMCHLDQIIRVLIWHYSCCRGNLSKNMESEPQEQAQFFPQRLSVSLHLQKFVEQKQYRHTSRVIKFVRNQANSVSVFYFVPPPFRHCGFNSSGGAECDGRRHCPETYNSLLAGFLLHIVPSECILIYGNSMCWQ